MAWRTSRDRYRFYRKQGYTRRRAFMSMAKRSTTFASTPYIAGAAVGFTGIIDQYVPAQFQNVLMIAAVAPSGLMKGKALGTLKAVAQGYIIGRVVKGITGFGGINTASGMSGGPWL